MAPAPNRRALGLLLAWLLLDASMGIYLGLNGPSTISRILLAAGLVLLLFVLLWRPPASQLPSFRAVEIGFVALLALELAAHVVVPFRPEPPTPTIPVPALAFVALVALGLWHAPRLQTDRLAAWAIGVAIATAMLARFAIVAYDVEPGFDVHLIQEAGGNALLAGQNPYAVRTAYDSGYPYWPLSAFMAAGGLLLGDARWGLLLADAITAVAFVAIARNIGAPARLGALAAALLLWNSSGLYITWQSLPEPLVIAFAALAVAAITRRGTRGWLAGVALGLAVATKQLGLGLLPLLPLSRDRRRWTAFAVAGAVAAAIIVPFALLDLPRFLEGSVSSHMVEPARDYAVNLLDPLPGVLPRLNVPLVVTGVLALGIGTAVRFRWPDAIDGWLAGSIALLTVAFCFIGISFVNYYQIPLALLLVLIMVPDDFETEPGAPRAA
jgi:Glycosyltransferase family 87